MSWIDEYIGKYYEWLKRETYHKTDEQTGWTEITTPYTGLFNDPVVIFVKKDGDRILLSDDGMTIQNLELSGVSIFRSAKRKEWLDFVLTNYGIKFENGELTTVSFENDFSQKQHNLISAILEISDLEITAKHVVASMFLEDVRGFMDEQGVIYTPQFIVKGDTGLDFTFDFQIAGKTTELVIKTFNSLTKTNVSSYLFSTGDVCEARRKTSGKSMLNLAIVNDDERELKEEFISALRMKNVDVMMWSERNTPAAIAKIINVA